MAKAKSAVPQHYHPQLVTLVKKAPEGDVWLHEIKYGGYTIGCRIDRGTVTLIGRNGKDWTASFPEICDEAGRLSAEQAFLDGEVAIVLNNGRTSFQALQNAFGGGPPSGLVTSLLISCTLIATTMSPASHEDCKSALLPLLQRHKSTARIRYADHVAGDGPIVLQHACRMGLELKA